MIFTCLLGDNLVYNAEPGGVADGRHWVPRRGLAGGGAIVAPQPGRHPAQRRDRLVHTALEAYCSRQVVVSTSLLARL
jgi:hypothetical protein